MTYSRQVTVILVVLVGACATTPATRSGFLGDYSALESEDRRDRILVQRPAATFDPTLYTGVIIDPPRVEVRGLDRDDAMRLSHTLHDALVEQFGRGRAIVRTPGPSILRVRSAITGARRANVAANAATSLLLLPVTAGGVSAEAEVIDTRDGTRVAALSWSRRGSVVRDFTDSYASLGQARSGLRAFAAKLAVITTSNPDTMLSHHSTSDASTI